MTEASIVPSSEQPLRDDERAYLDIDELQAQAQRLEDRLQTVESEGQSRSLESVGQEWAQANLPDLLADNPKLVEMIVKNRKAIEMTKHMFTLMRLRQVGQISGFQQDAEFSRIVAKSHLPSEFHQEIDQKVDATLDQV